MKVIVMELPLYSVDGDNNLSFLNEEEAKYALEDFIEQLHLSDIVISPCMDGDKYVQVTQSRVRIVDAQAVLEEDTHMGIPIITDFAISESSYCNSLCRKFRP